MDNDCRIGESLQRKEAVGVTCEQEGLCATPSLSLTQQGRQSPHSHTTPHSALFSNLPPSHLVIKSDLVHEPSSLWYEKFYLLEMFVVLYIAAVSRDSVSRESGSRPVTVTYWFWPFTGTVWKIYDCSVYFKITLLGSWGFAPSLQSFKPFKPPLYFSLVSVSFRGLAWHS